MRRYLPPSAVNGPVSAWGLYKSDDDQTHSDDLCCRGGWRGGNFARAGAGLSGPPRSVYSTRRALSARRLSDDYRRGPARRISTRWKTTRRRTRRVRPRCRRPARCCRRNDPRYGRPGRRAPVYSDRGARRCRTGPILSPDDPRYGRPTALRVYSDRGAPPVILSPMIRAMAAPPVRPRRADGPILSPTAAGPTDRRRSIRIAATIAFPATGFVYPNDDRALASARGDRRSDRRGHRRGAASLRRRRRQADGAVRAAAGRTAGSRACAAPPNLRRQEVAFATKEPAGTLIVDTPNTYLYYVLGGGARSATASASAATASPGPACRRSRARPSGRIGIRRPR
jgi:hypothetical protein